MNLKHFYVYSIKLRVILADVGFKIFKPLFEKSVVSCSYKRINFLATFLPPYNHLKLGNITSLEMFPSKEIRVSPGSISS